MITTKIKKRSARVICILLTLILSIGSATFAYADTNETLTSSGVSFDKPIDSGVTDGNKPIDSDGTDGNKSIDSDGTDGDETPSDFGDCGIGGSGVNDSDAGDNSDANGDNLASDEKLTEGNIFDEDEYERSDDYLANECELCENECDCEKKQMFEPFGYTVLASGTMDDFIPLATAGLGAEGSAVWRLEESAAPEHPFLTHVRTLYIGEPGVVGTLNRIGTIDTIHSTPWQWGGLNNWNDISNREITRIVFLGPVEAGENLVSLFDNLFWVESIENIHYLDTSNTTNMARMFRNVGSTRSSGATGAFTTPTWFRLQLDLSTFDTSKVTNMEGLFLGMTLDFLDLSGWDTSKVTTMQNMFLGVHYLENLDVSHFITANVTNMRQMFAAHSQSLFNVGQILGRNSFKYLDVSNFDTSKVTTMDMMFYGSANITHLDLSNFDTSGLATDSSLVMHRMFQGMHSLVELDLRGWDTTGLHNNAMHRMFINNYIWDPARDNPTAAQNIPNIRILHLGPNFQFRAAASGVLQPAGTRSFVPTVPGSSILSNNTQWLGAWQEIGTGTIERPNGVIKTSTQLMNQHNQTPGAGTWVWRPRIYTINFDANGGEGVMTPGAPRHPDFNEIYTLDKNAFTKDGYKFMGWNTNADGTGTSFPDGHIFAPWTQASNMTLFAQWSEDVIPIQMTQITFNANHGIAPETSIQNATSGAIYASVMTLADVVALQSRAGFTFAGWWTTSAATGGERILPTMQIPADDHTLYARWTPITSGGDNGGGEITTPPQVTPQEPQNPFVDEHIWYVRGFPEGDFLPEQSITRAEISMILFRLIDSDDKHQPRSNDFSDVTDGWYAQAVSYLASRDIVTGFPDGTFRPNTPITRAELTAVLSRFFEIFDNDFHDFSDVENSHWAIAYIKNAANRGWVIGFEDDTFRPDNATTRAEAVTMMNRVLGRMPNPETIRYRLYPKLNSQFGKQRLFGDMTDTHWAYYQVMEAAIEHDFFINEDGNEIWARIYIPWL